MLIRSAGSFFRRAASSIASAATFRAPAGSCTASLRARTRLRCRPAVRAEACTGATCSGIRRSRRMCPATSAGTSSNTGKYPSRLNAFNKTTRANRCPSDPAASRAPTISSGCGVWNMCSSRADMNRLNRGYAVRSIDAIGCSDRPATPT